MLEGGNFCKLKQKKSRIPAASHGGAEGEMQIAVWNVIARKWYLNRLKDNEGASQEDM